MSDMHGDLPVIDESCDVVCICGDIVPLYMQRNIPQSVKWLKECFRNWCINLDCKKVVFIAGNHDFVFEVIHKDWLEARTPKDPNEPHWRKVDAPVDDCSNMSLGEYMSTVLEFPEKIVYLQDSMIEIDGKTFYGTPYIPELSGWAFYRPSDKLDELFRLIPEKLDVLLTHSPGKFVNDTGVSLDYTSRPEYGSAELTKNVQDKEIGLWLCGHVHSGNHKVEKYGDITTANVSIKNERYEVRYEPLVIEI